MASCDGVRLYGIVSQIGPYPKILTEYKTNANYDLESTVADTEECRLTMLTKSTWRKVCWHSFSQNHTVAADFWRKRYHVEKKRVEVAFKRVEEVLEQRYK